MYKARGLCKKKHVIIYPADVSYNKEKLIKIFDQDKQYLCV